MDRKITRSFFEGEKVFCCGYCELYFLLKRFDRIGYNSGIYGWNYDTFRFFVNDKTYYLTTGYRNTIGKKIPYELTKAANTAAEKIACDYNLSFEEQNKLINNILCDLFGSLTN